MFSIFRFRPGSARLARTLNCLAGSSKIAEDLAPSSLMDPTRIATRSSLIVGLPSGFRPALVFFPLLWDEYIERHPDGYRYSRFCELYRSWASRLSVTMRQAHQWRLRRVGVDYHVELEGHFYSVPYRFA